MDSNNYPGQTQIVNFNGRSTVTGQPSVYCREIIQKMKMGESGRAKAAGYYRFFPESGLLALIRRARHGCGSGPVDRGRVDVVILAILHVSVSLPLLV